MGARGVFGASLVDPEPLTHAPKPAQITLLTVVTCRSCPLGSGTGLLVLASPGHGVRWGVAAPCRFVGLLEHLSPVGTQSGERTFVNEGIRKFPEEVVCGLGARRRVGMHRARGSGCTGQRAPCAQGG